MRQPFALLIALPVAAVLVVPMAWAQAPEKAEPASVAVSAGELEAISGEYTDAKEPDTPLSFYAKDGQLTVESERGVPTALRAVSATEFANRQVTYRFRQAGTGWTVSLGFKDEPATELTRTGAAVHHVFHHYERREAMIPARDGVKLHVVILTPTDIAGPLPILVQRTPYGVDGTSEASFFGGRPELARDGYIYVGADIRGRYKSEGQFIMSRPMSDHRDPKAIDESTDTYDTVDWLVKNIPNNNGRVGFIGTSYPGFLAMAAGIDPHPAVKAISPQAPMIDVWMGDDFFHNGAFRQSYGYDYTYMMETTKENSSVDYGKDASGKPVDGYDYFLSRGSFQEDVKQSGAKMLPTWQTFLEHPAYDEVWSSRGVEQHLTKVTVPTLSVGGYYDQEDMWGPQEEYTRLEKHDTAHENFMVLGPWRHGSWGSSSRHLGSVQYGEPIGKEFRAGIEAKFFAHSLKDAPGTNGAGFDLEDTASFQTGSNTWQRYAHFPPASAHATPFCLGGTGILSEGAGCVAGRVSYVSDPANPVPYRKRPIQPTYGPGSEWYNWLTEDQRFVEGRKDVATWRLPVLTADLTITGEVVADIYAATTGSDGDFVVKLIDEYPEDDADPAMRGYELMTNMEIFRGRYRESFVHPKALKPNEVNEFRWSLHDVDHVFKKGHTVMVEVQSSWFPLYDRNPQRFVGNMMTARPEDFEAATVSVVQDERHRSAVILPVVR